MEAKPFFILKLSEGRYPANIGNMAFHHVPSPTASDARHYSLHPAGSHDSGDTSGCNLEPGVSTPASSTCLWLQGSGIPSQQGKESSDWILARQICGRETVLDVLEVSRVYVPNDANEYEEFKAIDGTILGKPPLWKGLVRDRQVTYRFLGLDVANSNMPCCSTKQGSRT